MARRDYVCPVIGKRRSGKSTLLRGDRDNPDAPDEGIAQWTEYARVFVLDPRNEWDVGLSFSSLKDLQRALHLAARSDYISDRKIWTFQPSSRDAVRGFFDLMAPNQKRGKPGVPGLYILDEASQYMDSHSVDEGLMRIVQLGGNEDQSVVLVARLWNQLNVNVRTQRDALVAFRGVTARTVKKWRRSVDPRADAVKHLEGHEFMVLGERRLLDWYNDAQSLDSCKSGD